MLCAYFDQFIIPSSVYIILLVLQLNLSVVLRDKVSGQALAEIRGTRPYLRNDQ